MGGVVDLATAGVRHAFERAQPPQVVPQARDGFWWRTEFLYPGVNSVDGLQYSVTNAGSNGTYAADPGRPGVLLQNVAAAAADGATASAFFGPAGALNIINVAGGGPVFWEASMLLSAVSDGANNVSYRVGFGSVTNSLTDEQNAIALEHDRQVNGNNNWFMVSGNVGVRTRTDTGVAPVSGVYTRLRMQLDSTATRASFSIDGVPVGSLTTNLPAIGNNVGVICKFAKTLGAAARLARTDYIEVRQDFGARR